MKKHTKILSLFLALIMIVSCIPITVFAERITGEIPKLDATITVLDPNIFCYEEYAKETFNQIRITDVDLFYVCEDYTGKCAIPSEIDGCPVTSIEYEALANWDLSEVDLIIPQSVTWIDGDSFVGTNAKSVTVLNPECKIDSSSVFSSCTTIIGYPDSEVHKYAKNFELNFKCIEHIWNTSYTVDKAATCTEDGLKSIHCTACDEVKENTVVTATGHSWYNDENNIRICKICECSEDNCDSTNLSYNRDELFEHISTKSNDGTNSVSFGNLSSNGYNYCFVVSDNSFFAQYKIKDSNWTKVISIAYDYNTDIVTSSFAQSGTGGYYAADAVFNADGYVNADSIVYKDATGSNYGGMCITYAENFAATAIPKINQKMLSEFGISLCKIGFTSYSHTHTGGEATCCSYAICEMCGKVYGSLENHITEIKNKIYATCYEPGYTGDLVCTICNEVIEYGSSIPIIEREPASGKFDLLKQYVLNNGKSDAADNKYIYYSDIIYDTEDKPINVYAKITYIDEFAIFRLLYTSGEGKEQTSITMDIEENGSDVVIVEYSFEDIGLYANASVSVNNYSKSSNVFFEKNQESTLSNEQIQNLCNSELRVAMDTWNLLLLEHLQFDMNMSDLGFVVYETHSNDHEYNSKITSPTCTQQGYTTYTCSCGDSYIDNYVDATGHTPGSWEVVVEAQVGADGLEQQKCTVCGEVLDERVIPALPDVSYMLGDANGDGKITAADARIALRISAKVDSLEKYNLTAEVLDVTGDGKLTAADARKILRIAAKIE